MPHILISDCDNPFYSYGNTIVSVLFENKEFDAKIYKGKYGIDEYGRQTEYTNSPHIKHYLIKDCGAEEFVKALLDSPRIKNPVNFRIVSDECVEKKALSYGEWPRNKVNLEEVFKGQFYTTTTYLKNLEMVDEVRTNITFQ